MFMYLYWYLYVCYSYLYIYIYMWFHYRFIYIKIYLSICLFIMFIYLFTCLFIVYLSIIIYLCLSIYLMCVCVCLIYHQTFAYKYYRNCRCVRSDGQITTFLCPSIPSLQRFPPRRVSQTTAAYRTPSWLCTGVSAWWGDCMFSRLDMVWNCWIAVARFWIFYHLWSSNYS